MKSHTPAGCIPATKPTARKITATGRIPANPRPAGTPRESKGEDFLMIPDELVIAKAKEWKCSEDEAVTRIIEESTHLTLELHPSPEQLKKWQRVATSQGLSVQDWIVEVLDATSALVIGAQKGARS